MLFIWKTRTFHVDEIEPWSNISNFNFQVFVYHFGYRGQNSQTQLDVYNWPPKVVPKPVSFGVGNGDDLIYLFPVLSGTFRSLPHDDLIFSQRFIQLLTSFAKDGQPRIKMSDPNDETKIPDFIWHPVNKNGSYFFLSLFVGFYLKTEWFQNRAICILCIQFNSNKYLLNSWLFKAQSCKLQAPI